MTRRNGDGSEGHRQYRHIQFLKSYNIITPCSVPSRWYSFCPAPQGLFIFQSGKCCLCFKPYGFSCKSVQKVFINPFLLLSIKTDFPKNPFTSACAGNSVATSIPCLESIRHHKTTTRLTSRMSDLSIQELGGQPSYYSTP